MSSKCENKAICKKYFHFLYNLLYQCTSCFMTTTSLYKILQYNDKPRCCSSIMVLYSKAHQQTISCKMCTQASQYYYWKMDFCCNVQYCIYLATYITYHIYMYIDIYTNTNNMRKSINFMNLVLLEFSFTRNILTT